MVCGNHGRNYQLGDPPRHPVLRQWGVTYKGGTQEKEVRCQETLPSSAEHRLVNSETLTVGDEWEGIIYSLRQIIAPFGPELENSF